MAGFFIFLINFKPLPPIKSSPFGLLWKLQKEKGKEVAAPLPILYIPRFLKCDITNYPSSQDNRTSYQECAYQNRRNILFGSSLRLLAAYQQSEASESNCHSYGNYQQSPNVCQKIIACLFKRSHRIRCARGQQNIMKFEHLFVFSF
jgi:hypothetical protein